jgi:repressor LexA
VSELTPKQLKVLTFIRQFIADHGVPPTRGEIADGLHLKNRQGIDQHLRALQAKGAIELLAGMSRGIRVLDPLAPAMEPVSHRPQTPISLLSLPVLGRIAAGTPILAVENIEEQISIDARLAPIFCCGCAATACAMRISSTAICWPCTELRKRVTARS